MGITDKQRGKEVKPHNMTGEFEIDGEPAARDKRKKIGSVEITSTMTNEALDDFTFPDMSKVDDIVLNLTSPSGSTAGGTVDIGSSIDADGFIDGFDVTTSTGLYRGITTVSSAGSSAHAGGQVRATGTSTGSFSGFEADLYLFYTSIED